MDLGNEQDIEDNNLSLSKMAKTKAKAERAALTSNHASTEQEIKNYFALKTDLLSSALGLDSNSNQSELFKEKKQAEIDLLKSNTNKSKAEAYKAFKEGGMSHEDALKYSGISVDY